MQFFLQILILSVFSMHTAASEYVVVANQNMHKVSLGQIRALFLKKSSYVGDTKIVPLNLGSRNKIRESFEKKILHLHLSRLKSYWMKQHYLGHRPPISMKSQESIKAFIQKVDGAIGYIELKNVDKNTKILYRWSD